MARRETRTFDYNQLVATVVRYYREQGKLVDFRIIPEGAIVGCYRLRNDASEPWQDQLPVGTSADKYRKTIQNLVPAFFPGEELTIVSVMRHGNQVLVTVEIPEEQSGTPTEQRLAS